MPILYDIRERISAYRFSVAVRPLRPQLVKMIERRVGQMADAEDIVQTALLRAYIKWNDAGREAFTAFPFWLRLVAFNVMKDHFRELPAANEDEFDPERHVLASGTAPSALDECLADEQARVFSAAVLRLPEELRHVLVMREIDLLSTDEIASALDIGISNVKIRTMRAKRVVLSMLGA